MTPAFKKDEIFLKNNYRSVSILSSVLKIYKRCMYNQINEHFHSCFTKCWFQKGSNAQHCLLILAEKCREILDKQGYTALRESVQMRNFLWSLFPRIRTEYGDLFGKSPYSVRTRKNTDQKKLHIWTLYTQCWDPINWFTKSLWWLSLSLTMLMLVAMVFLLLTLNK